MFTGIVEDVGTLAVFETNPTGARLEVHTKLDDISVGDSVAIDGVCLTATTVGPDGFTADASHETLSRTTLGKAAAGIKLNIERALAASGRLGGHIVQGHVDGLGEILEITSDGEARIYRFGADAQLLKFIAEKGSVTVDGVSLTVNGVDPTSFIVTLIPHTLSNTTLGEKGVQAPVNLETDVIAKYVVHYLTGLKGDDGLGGVDLDFLKSHGFA